LVKDVLYDIPAPKNLGSTKILQSGGP